MYDLAALEADLAGTLFAGKLHFVRVTGSTNSDALAAARLGAPPGAVFLAEEQLAGRGRGHHGWISSVGEGLYASVLLRPQFPAARLPLLPLAAGLAAAAAIRAVSGLIVDLRWPNDLLLGPRKAGGILVESQTASAQHKIARAGSVAFAVVGIGINVHRHVFPPAWPRPPRLSIWNRAGASRARRSSWPCYNLWSVRLSHWPMRRRPKRFPRVWSRLPPGFAAAASRCMVRNPARALPPASTRMDSSASNPRMGSSPCEPAVSAPQKAVASL